jgi:hypothetical protein
MRITIGGARCFTLREAAAIAGRTYGTMRVYAQREYFPVIRLGHLDLISYKALRRFLIEFGKRDPKTGARTGRRVYRFRKPGGRANRSRKHG